MSDDEDFTVPTRATSKQALGLQSNTTVYVSSLPADFTDSQLLDLFSSIGPVKKAFLVVGKLDQKGNAFGYVMYTTEQDAMRAVESMHHSKVNDQEVSVVMAKPKRKASEKPAKEKEKPVELKPRVEPRVHVASQTAQSRCVLVSGWPTSVDAKMVFKKAKKCGEVCKVIFPAPESNSSCFASRIVFVNCKTAMKAWKKLDQHVFKGETLTATILPQKAGRIIVRNLPFDISLEELREMFQHFGKVVDATLPEKNGKPAGFAFMVFDDMMASLNAIEASSKGELKFKERSLAVDWALNKVNYSSLKDSVIEEKQITEEKMSSSDSEEDEKKEMVAKPQQKRISKDVSDGRTLFIRNFPFDVTEEEIRSVFREFGVIRRVTIVKGKSGSDVSSKGSAFVEFKESLSASSALEAASIASSRSSFKSNSSAAQMIAAEGISSFSIRGRVLLVDLAISREETLSLSKKQNHQVDKRNLSLAKVGLILPGDAASEGMDAKVLERREKIWQETKKSLENPNYSVSRTRLSVQNLPPQMDEKALSKLFLEASRADSRGPVKLHQVKIARDNLRKDSSGMFRSKKYGFVEFTRHEAAMAALLKLNNGPQHLIVAFALDDARKLRLRSLRKDHKSQAGEKADNSTLLGKRVKSAKDSSLEPKKKKQRTQKTRRMKSQS